MSLMRKSSSANSYSESSFEDEFDIIRHVSKTSGLNSDQLSKVCSWVESKEIDESGKLQLIKCLIPEENGGTIPEEVCIRLTCLLNSRSISVITKVEILKYMISAYSFMETSGRFQMLYENFLLFLKKEEMRSYAAHFIFLFTQKKHVTFRRVQYIYKLVEECNQLPCLVTILHAYFLHCPEYFDDDIKVDLSYSFENLGPYPDLIRKVHHAYEPNFSDISFITQGINTLGTFADSCVSVEKSDILARKCTPFHQLYKRFRALEQSSNVSKILESNLKRFFLTTRLKPDVQIKVQDYILSVLHRDMDSEDIVKKHLEIFRLHRSIAGMSEFTELLFSKEPYNPDIAELICYEPVCCFKKISYKLQVILEKIMATDDVTVKCQWLDATSKLLCYWILQSKDFVPCSENCGEDLTFNDDSSDTPVVHISSVETKKLNSSVNYLFDCLLSKDCQPFILNRILSHYEMAFYACKLKKNYVASFPSVSIFQLSLFSLTPLILDVLGRVMLRINEIHGLIPSDLNEEEYLLFKASCNDIKKLFLDGSYESDSTYLAKAKVFKKLQEIIPEFEDFFKLQQHPALLLKTAEFDERSDISGFLQDPNNRLDFFFYLASNGIPNFMKLINSIK